MAIRELKVCLLGVSSNCLLYYLFFVFLDVEENPVCTAITTLAGNYLSKRGQHIFACRLVWSKASLFSQQLMV